MKRLYPLLLILLFIGCGNDALNQKQTSLNPTLNAPLITVAGSTVASGVPVNSALQLEFKSGVLNSIDNLAHITLYHVNTSSYVPLDYGIAVGQSSFVLVSPQMHELSANSYYTLTVDANFTFEDNTTTTAPFTYDFFTTSSSDATAPSITVENNLSAPFELQGSLKFRSNEPLNIHHASTQSYYFVKETNTSVQVPAIPFAGPTMSMFTPAWPLEPDTNYTLTIPTLYDLANNAIGTLPVSITTAPKFALAQTFSGGVDFGMRVDQNGSTSVVFFDANRTLHVYRPDPMSADFNYTEQNSSYFYDTNRTIYNLDATEENIFVFSKENNDSNGTIHYFQASNLVNTMNVSVTDAFEQNATYTMIDVNSSGMGYGCIVKNDLNTSNVHLYDYMSNTLNFREALSITTPLSCHINADTGALYIIAADNKMYIYNIENTGTRITMNYAYVPANFTETDTGQYWTNGNNALYYKTYIDNKIKLYTLSSSTIEFVTIYGTLAFVGNSTSPYVYVIDFANTPQLIVTLTTSANVTSLAVATHEYYTGNAYITTKALLVGHNDSIEQISLNGFGEAVPKITVPLSYKPTGLTQDIDGYPYLWHDNLIEELDFNGTVIDIYDFNRTIRELISLNVYPNFIITHDTGFSTVQLDSNSSSIFLYDERTISNISAVEHNNLGKLYVGTSDGWLYTYSENNLTLIDENSTNIGSPITSLYFFSDSTDLLLVGTLDNNITVFNCDINGTPTSINQSFPTKDIPLDIRIIGNGEMGYAIAVAEGFSGVEIFHPDLSWITIDYNHTVSTPGFANGILEFSYSWAPQDDYILSVTDTTGLVTVQHSILDGFEEVVQYYVNGTKWRKFLLDPMYGELYFGLSNEGLVIFENLAGALAQ